MKYNTYRRSYKEKEYFKCKVGTDGEPYFVGQSKRRKIIFAGNPKMPGGNFLKKSFVKEFGEKDGLFYYKKFTQACDRLSKAIVKIETGSGEEKEGPLAAFVLYEY